MTVVEKYRHFVIVSDHREYGIFDHLVGMIIQWFTRVKEAEEEIDCLEED